MGDLFLVGETGLLALKSAADQGQNQGQDSQMLLLEMFSKLLELLTLRHRLIEMSLETVHLARSVGGLTIRMEGNRLWIFLPQALPHLCSQSSQSELSKWLKWWPPFHLPSLPVSLFRSPTGLSRYSTSLGSPLSTWAFSPFSHCLLIRCLMLIY